MKLITSKSTARDAGRRGGAAPRLTASLCALAAFASAALAAAPAAGQARDERSRMLVELSAALGASHHLRRICAGLDDQRLRQ